MKTALLFGSSGLVGGHLLRQLIKNSDYSKIKIFVRLEPEINDPKLEIIKTNFNDLENYREDIKGVSCLKPNGAFYVFPSCKKLLGKKTKLKTDSEFVEKLLEKANVAVVQGSAFGLSGYFRISYATSMEKLKIAMERIKSFCESLS